MHVCCVVCASAKNVFTCTTCSLVSYCSEHCQRKDRFRHKETCSKHLSLKNAFRTGCATLNRVACGIFDDPATAYMYAVLHRMECPYDMGICVPLERPPELYEKLVDCKFDAYFFSDAASRVFQIQTGKRIKWHLKPEVLHYLQKYEFDILKKIGNGAEGCLMLMLMSLDTRHEHTALLYKLKGLLMVMYDVQQKDPLMALFEKIKSFV